MGRRVTPHPAGNLPGTCWLLPSLRGKQTVKHTRHRDHTSTWRARISPRAGYVPTAILSRVPGGRVKGLPVRAGGMPAGSTKAGTQTEGAPLTIASPSTGPARPWPRAGHAPGSKHARQLHCISRQRARERERERERGGRKTERVRETEQASESESRTCQDVPGAGWLLPSRQSNKHTATQAHRA